MINYNILDEKHICFCKNLFIVTLLFLSNKLCLLRQITGQTMTEAQQEHMDNRDT